MNKLYQLLKANASPARNQMRVANDADATTIYLYDVIDADWGINAQDFARALAAVQDGPINLRVNSPGGDVFEARAIAAAIQQHKGKVTAFVDGLAASAATTIVTAADEVVIADGSFFMIHNAWSLAIGNKNDLRETASLLEKIDGAIAADYSARTGKASDEIAVMMDAETWLTAQEAVDMKFADRLAEKAKAQNEMKRWNVAAFEHPPTALTVDSGDAERIATQRARNERRLRLLEID